MKILIVINALHYGGAEKQAVMDANALAGCGHRITVGYNRAGDLIDLLSASVRKYQIKYKNIMLASLQLFLHLLFNRYHAIHSHMFWAEKVSALPGKITGHRVLFNEHGLGLWRRWYHILVMRIISLWADKIIVSCRTNEEVRIKRENLNRNKLLTIYNSFDINNIPKYKNDIHDFSRKGRKFVIGFVGRFTHVKRLEILVDMAEQLVPRIPELMFVLVGDGEEKGRLEGEIIKRKLGGYFYLPGFVSCPTQYLKNFDIFVLPSAIEGFSIALLEAGAYGIPALAFNVGGNHEIIQDGITGYIIPDNDLASFNERIISLYENKRRRFEMGAAARGYVQRNFSMSSRLEDLMKLYGEP